LGNLELNGNVFFKDRLFFAYGEVGHVNLHFIQIRQLAPGRFELATSRSPHALKLCAALARTSCSHPVFPHDGQFELRQLTDEEIARELRRKPTLFTTKHMQPVRTSG